MERLALHIEYLLLRHDCVVVPGFGAFINVYHSALDNSETQCFQPMISEVRFNSALKHNDGMLATSYSRREGVSYAEGREMVRVAVSDLQDTLALEGEVSVGRLGRIRTDRSGNLSFHPLLTPNRLAASLGYLPVTRHVAAVETASAVTDIKQDTPETVVEKPIRKFDTERNYYIPINKMFARMAGSFLVIAVLCLSLILPFTRDYHEDQASVVPVKALTSAVTKASQEIESAKPALPAESESETEVATPEPKRWHLVVGTFRSQKEADNFIATINDSPYDLHTVASKRMVRVVALSATDKETLLPELNSQEFQTAFPQAWIFHQQ